MRATVRGHTKILIGCIAGAVIAGAVILLFGLMHRSNTPDQLSAAQKQAGFPLFYPSPAPAGFQLDKNSISGSPLVVVYSYTYDGSKQLSISVQPTNNDIDPNQFRPTSDFTTTIGHAYVVDLEDRTTAAVLSGKSWLLINAPDKIAVDRLTQFINSLRPL